MPQVSNTSWFLNSLYFMLLILFLKSFLMYNYMMKGSFNSSFLSTNFQAMILI